jgi:hypothetical protein
MRVVSILDHDGEPETLTWPVAYAILLNTDTARSWFRSFDVADRIAASVSERAPVNGMDCSAAARTMSAGPAPAPSARIDAGLVGLVRRTPRPRRRLFAG